jgi:hypothetical protein
MARSKQSKPNLSLDRRQLLLMTAAVTAAGIVPNTNTAEIANPTQAVNAARISLSENSALNVCAATARWIEEIAERNEGQHDALLHFTRLYTPLGITSRSPSRTQSCFSFSMSPSYPQSKSIE